MDDFLANLTDTQHYFLIALAIVSAFFIGVAEIRRCGGNTKPNHKKVVDISRWK
jgi:hypothetical protein